MNASTQARQAWELGRGGEPLGFEAGDANLYRYCDNDPTDATDPTGLVKLEAKSVGEGPQTGLFPKEEPHFQAYWGVGLYLDKASLDELNKAGGGYIIEKRTIEWKFEGKYIPPSDRPRDRTYNGKQEGSVTAWFLDVIKFNGSGDLDWNNDFSHAYGGARKMEDDSIVAAYFSIVNNELTGIPFTKGTITVKSDYQLYSGVPSKETSFKFTNSSGEVPTLPSGLGFDEYRHKPWTADDPQVNVKPLLTGKEIKATMTWDSGSQPSMSFESPNTEIGPGPQRPGRKAFFPAWKYDTKQMKWIRAEPTGDQNP